MSDVNLSKLIRDYHGKHPEARPKEIAMALNKKGHEVSNTYVSLILFKLRTEGEPGPVGRPVGTVKTAKAPKAPKAKVVKAPKAKAPKAKVVKAPKAPKASKRVVVKAKSVLASMNLSDAVAQQIKLIESNIQELNNLRDRLVMVEAKAQEAVKEAQA